MQPQLIKGDSFSDFRGTLWYNNAFDASQIRRIYTLRNKDLSNKRGWQGHKIEQRWFSAVKGAFEIQLIAIDDWDNPSKNLLAIEFDINDTNLDVLHVPAGYVSCIRSKEKGSKLLVMADFLLGEVKDEYRYDLDYFLQH